MKYWWVNQNQTFNQEITGGYLWSPQRKSNGDANRFYDNMRMVQAGDYIVSYAAQRLGALGIATSAAFEAPRPDDFPHNAAVDRWAGIGWRVDVHWSRLEADLRPSHFFDDISPLLPERYSPLTQKGKGQQAVYLAAIPEPLGTLLVRRMVDVGLPMPDNANRAQPSGERAARFREELEQHIASNLLPNGPVTDREALSSARIGQGLFRRRLLEHERKCRVSGVDNPDYLIASHIWPWRHANNAERLDGENGLLLSPNVDFAFDRGLISFGDDGRLLISPIADMAALHRFGVPAAGTQTGPFTPRQKLFLRRHRSGHGAFGRVFRALG